MCSDNGNAIDEVLWRWLLLLKKYCAEHALFPPMFNPVEFSPTEASPLGEVEPENKTTHYHQGFIFGTTQQHLKLRYLNNNLELVEYNGISADQANLLCRYIKLLYLAYNCHTFSDRPFVLAHLAQTLDGKIATNSGNSRWISNQDNLIHAHRLRAISDAICVGGKTLQNDQPKLTVRHVEGCSPQIVIISNNSLTSSEHSQAYESAWFYTLNSQNLNAILNDLKSRNIHFLFVEGGAFLISKLLELGLVDLLQLHISPKILGSGKGIQLPIADQIDESITFKESQFFTVGEEIMFEGIPDYATHLA